MYILIPTRGSSAVCLEQVIFPDVEAPRLAAGTSLDAGEAMPASIASSPMHPAPVHPPTTKPTHDESRRQIAPDPTVLGRLRHPHALHRDEHLVIHERFVRYPLGHLPLADRVVPQRSRSSAAGTSA